MTTQLEISGERLHSWIARIFPLLSSSPFNDNVAAGQWSRSEIDYTMMVGIYYSCERI